MPICTILSAPSIGVRAASPVSSAGPCPQITATGIPWMFPDGDDDATLKSECASSQNIASVLPCSAQNRDKAAREPIARL